MPIESMAPANAPPAEPATDATYQALLAALSENARGRDFLAEYARRNRSADTDMLLAALSRLEAHIAREGSAVERLRDELRTLLIAIRLARPDIEPAASAAKATKLAALLDLLGRRIEAIAGVEAGELRAANALSTAEAMTDETAATRAVHAAGDPSPEPVNEAAPPTPMPGLPPAEPLAALMALSEDERLALFT